jgi:hypothetical protein
MSSRQFVIRSILFILLLLAVNFALDQSFKRFSVHNHINEMMDRQYAEFDTTMKYLTMGNSHNCINTRILDQCFNYGSPSENYIQSYYKLKSVLHGQGKKPEYLLLQADISSFGPKIASRYEYNSYWIRHIDYLELARIRRSRDVLTKWLEGKFFSYAGNYKDIQLSILYRIKIKTLEMYRGYRPHRDYHNFADEPNRRKAARNKANLILSRESYFDPAIRVYFEKILQLCQENDVKVMLVRFPMTREFYEEEVKIVPADALYREVEALASKYPVYQGILDYHNLYADRPDYYFDPDHLNVEGSDMFTAHLAGDLAKLGSASFPEQPAE